MTRSQSRIPSQSPNDAARDFPLQEARRIAQTLSRHRPAIYWPDFLLHASLGWAAFVFAVGHTASPALYLAALTVAALALYRAVIFIHEISHMKRGTFRAFRLVWNLLCGFPMQVPSFTYAGVHMDHHRPRIYGTREDGEYLPFATGGPLQILAYPLLSFLLPPLFFVRFLILAPLSWGIPPLRGFLWAHVSSLTIDLTYRRPPAGKDEAPVFQAQEVFAFLYSATAVGLVVTGIWPPAVLLTWYAVTFVIFFLNSLRTLAAHAYRNPGDQPMTRTEEFMDSVDVPGWPFFTALWAPVGLRYHATHHLFPSLPYHELGKARRLLLATLPDVRAIEAATRKSLWQALSQLLSEARAQNRDPSAW